MAELAETPLAAVARRAALTLSPLPALSRRALLAAPLTAVPACRRQREGYLGYLFVANSEGKSVAVVDLSAMAIARFIHLNANPAALADVPGRPFLYALAAAEGLLMEISVPALSVSRQLSLGAPVLALQPDPRGHLLHLLAADPPRLLRVGLPAFRVTQSIRLPAAGTCLDVSPDASLTAITAPETQELYLCDPQGALQRTGLPASGHRVRFRSDGRQVLVTHPERKEISVLEAPGASSREGGSLIVRLPLALRPENLCFNRDGGQLFVTGGGEDAVAVIYPYRTEVAETFLAGANPGAMASGGAPEYLFVANRGSSTVTIVSVLSRKVQGVVHVGNDPCSITVTPDNRFAAVLNRGSGDVAIIRLSAIGRNPRAKLTPLLSMVPVGSAPVAAVVRPL